MSRSRRDVPLGRLVGLRDALRRLAAEVTGDARPSAGSATAELGAAVDAVNEAAAAVSAIAQEAVDLFGQDARLSLRACHAPGRVLYFVKDHPRREWCSPACGNRARAARHYRRHRRPAA